MTLLPLMIKRDGCLCRIEGPLRGSGVLCRCADSWEIRAPRGLRPVTGADGTPCCVILKRSASNSGISLLFRPSFTLLPLLFLCVPSLSMFMLRPFSIERSLLTPADVCVCAFVALRERLVGTASVSRMSVRCFFFCYYSRCLRRIRKCSMQVSAFNLENRTTKLC